MTDGEVVVAAGDDVLVTWVDGTGILNLYRRHVTGWSADDSMTTEVSTVREAQTRAYQWLREGTE
ncbi:MAG TPA: hypothetical protein PK775_07415 [Rectinema sp.]|nr:hypothetical protein [Rectinema sp.]